MQEMIIEISSINRVIQNFYTVFSISSSVDYSGFGIDFLNSLWNCASISFIDRADLDIIIILLLHQLLIL